MNLANKVFKNNETGETVRVLDSFENIAILENKQKIDVRTLMDNNKFTEQIDPSSFFNNQGAYNILAEKIKNIPTHMIQDDEESTNITVDPANYINDQFQPTINESAIVMSTEEDEKAELAKKYGAVIDSSSSLQRQNESFAKLLGEDSEAELPQIPVRTYDEPEMVQRVEVDRGFQPQNTPIKKVEVEDPIITMFKRTKRNVEFKINVEVSDKIPRLDFIEMMEDSYEISMIEFLADEFTNKILQDPSIIRESIKDKIKQLVYGAPTTLSSNNNKTNKEKKETEKDSKNIQGVNDQITDSVTQINTQITDAVTQVKVDPEKVIKTEPKMVNEAGKKTTRKPRAKKETTK